MKKSRGGPPHHGPPLHPRAPLRQPTAHSQVTNKYTATSTYSGKTDHIITDNSKHSNNPYISILNTHTRCKHNK